MSHLSKTLRLPLLYPIHTISSSQPVSPLNGNFTGVEERGKGEEEDERMKGGEWTQPGGEHFLSVSLIYRGIGHQ